MEWNGYDNSLNSSLYKNRYCYLKSDLKRATGIDTLKFGKEVDLANLKWDIDELDIDKLKTTFVDLIELSNLVKNDAVKKTVCD